MKNLFRQIVGFIVIGPFVLMTFVFSLFMGREKAVKRWGPPATSLAKFLVKLSLPKIRTPAEYDRFQAKLKTNFQYWQLFYDYSVAYEDKDTLEMRILNCPFCEVSAKLGISELNPYICQGDWEAAKDYADQWNFERQHQIGTGDNFCDHTYRRKLTQDVAPKQSVG